MWGGRLKIEKRVLPLVFLCFFAGALLTAGFFLQWCQAGARILSGLDLIDGQGGISGFLQMALFVSGILAIFLAGAIALIVHIDDGRRLALLGSCLSAAGFIGLTVVLARGVIITGPNFVYGLPPTSPANLSTGFWVCLAGILAGFVTQIYPAVLKEG
jgi:hypothetical protein